jgi:hypothetical protein
MRIIDEIQTLKKRVEALENARPSDEATALADTFTRDLTLTDDVVRSLGVSIQQLYTKFDKLEINFKIINEYIKELRKYIVRKLKKL